MVNQEHIEESINKALLGQSNLTQDVLNIRGFSTPTIRHLFNNICNIENGTYLEIGLFCGGTFCSSFNKDTISIGIEDFSQDFGVNTVADELPKNINENWRSAKDVHLFNADCFKIESIEYNSGIDVYFFDAEHSKESQAKALPHFIKYMSDKFIYIVDDYNWALVNEGTAEGFETLKGEIEIEKSWVLKGGLLQDDPIWHNGVAIFLINKK